MNRKKLAKGLSTTVDNERGRKTELLSLVPAGRPIGNKSLRTQLIERGWTEELYWEVRNGLVEEGVLDIGRGKGGSVFRMQDGPPRSLEREKKEFNRERRLYSSMLEVIRNEWARDHGFVREQSIAVVTAAQGKKATGGKWTRPDITFIAVRTFPYLPCATLDVITFEVKATDAIDVTVIYEVLAHRRAATKAYALLHIPANRRGEVQPSLEKICDEARLHGVGVLVAENAVKYDTWEELVVPVRFEPEPERLNEFLAKQMPDDELPRIAKWLRK